MTVKILRNYKIKLIVLTFAIFIWFFVVTENDYEYMIEVPVNILNVPAGKVILNEIPRTAKIKVHGIGKALIALSVSRGARVDLDLSEVERHKTFILEPKNVFFSRAGSSIEAKEIISPDSINIILDDFINKKVVIVPKFDIKPAPGYTVAGDVKLNPDSLLISGPASLVSKIDEISTQEAEYTDLRSDLKEVIDLAPLPSDKITASTDKIEVYLDIQKLLERTISEVPVEVRNAPRNMIVHVVPSTLSLVLEGGADLVSQVSRNDIVAYIDYKRMKNASGRERPAYIETPPGVSYRDVKPKLFKIVLERRSAK
jgi:hypothetical protein